jgi:hypothetical protein
MLVSHTHHHHHHHDDLSLCGDACTAPNTTYNHQHSHSRYRTDNKISHQVTVITGPRMLQQLRDADIHERACELSSGELVTDAADGEEIAPTPSTPVYASTPCRNDVCCDRQQLASLLYVKHISVNEDRVSVTFFELSIRHFL